MSNRQFSQYQQNWQYPQHSPSYVSEVRSLIYGNPSQIADLIIKDRSRSKSSVFDLFHGIDVYERVVGGEEIKIIEMHTRNIQTDNVPYSHWTNLLEMIDARAHEQRDYFIAWELVRIGATSADILIENGGANTTYKHFLRVQSQIRNLINP